MNAVVDSVKTTRTSLAEKVAGRFGVDADKMLSTLKATAFKQKDGEASNEQMMALLVVADQYGLNPWTKEIYAFPDKQNGIVPIVGVDGWLRIMNSHEEFDGMSFEYSEDIVQGDDHKDCPLWCKCIIQRKDRSNPIEITEYFDECYRPPFKKNNYNINGPWQSHTKRMLRHKAMIQAARSAFGYVGIYDQDEAERIIEGHVVDAEYTETAGSTSVDDLNASVAAAQQDKESVTEQPADDSNAPDLASILHQIETAETGDDLDVAEDLINSLKGKDKSTAKSALLNRSAELQPAE